MILKVSELSEDSKEFILEMINNIMQSDNKVGKDVELW